MKHLLILMALLALMMLGGCRLDPDGLLGNDPADKEEEVLHSSDAYSLCRDQNVIVGEVQNAASCATPANLRELLAGFVAGKNNMVRLSFNKMWDGTYPKLIQLQYHTWESGKSGAAKNTTCQLLTGTSSTREYECKLDLGVNASSWAHYTFQSMTLGHDTCASKAVYTASFLYDLCNEPGVYYSTSDITVYFNREPWPALNPWEEKP